MPQKCTCKQSIDQSINQIFILFKHWMTLAKKTNQTNKQTKKKMLRLALDYVKKLLIWTIARRSRLLSLSDFGSKVYKVWPPLRDRSYMLTCSFWLCVRTRCLSICAPSFVALAQLSTEHLERGTLPKLYPATLNYALNWNTYDSEKSTVQLASVRLAQARPELEGKEVYQLGFQVCRLNSWACNIFLHGEHWCASCCWYTDTQPRNFPTRHPGLLGQESHNL